MKPTFLQIRLHKLCTALRLHAIAMIGACKRKNGYVKNAYEKNVCELNEVRSELKKVEARGKEAKRIWATEKLKMKQEIKRLSEESERLNETVKLNCTRTMDALFTDGGRNVAVHGIVTDEMLPTINATYRKRKGKGEWIAELEKHCEGIKERELFVCILYHENVTDDKAIASILHTTVGTFRTMKSRLKKKLEDAQECETAKEIVRKMSDKF